MNRLAPEPDPEWLPPYLRRVRPPPFVRGLLVVRSSAASAGAGPFTTSMHRSASRFVGSSFFESRTIDFITRKAAGQDRSRLRGIALPTPILPLQERHSQLGTPPTHRTPFSLLFDHCALFCRGLARQPRQDLANTDSLFTFP